MTNFTVNCFVLRGEGGNNSFGGAGTRLKHLVVIISEPGRLDGGLQCSAGAGYG